MSDAVFDGDYTASDGVSSFVFGEEFVQAGGNELFHAQLELAFFLVQLEDKSFDDLADTQHIGGMIEAAVGNDLADVDQALNAFRNLDEGAEFSDASDRAFDDRAGR